MDIMKQRQLEDQRQRTQLVKPIYGIISSALKQLPDARIVPGAKERHAILQKRAVEVAIERSVEGSDFVLGFLKSYMQPALHDFWFIADGAFDFAQNQSGNQAAPQTLVINGAQNLLAPAVCPEKDGQWSEIKTEWIGQHNVDGLSAPRSVFSMVQADKPQVNFNKEALDLIGSYVTPESGCPARGTRLENMFQCYVEAIFVEKA